ncbi:hypothetical protein [Streptomyces bullii]|uniref:Uncharacterized protein n=1 Tax=Streptomyces bullii TaxID=349910 RepID=A0ABW0UK43_9ACTN
MPRATAGTPHRAAHDDFNGEGDSHVAIGAPGTTVDGAAEAGAVGVL